MIVGAAVHRWRGDADFDSRSVHAHDGIARRARLHLQFENQRVAFPARRGHGAWLGLATDRLAVDAAIEFGVRIKQRISEPGYTAPATR